MGGDDKKKKLEDFTLPKGMAEYLEMRFGELNRALDEFKEAVVPAIEKMSKEVAEIHAQGGVHTPSNSAPAEGEEEGIHPLLQNVSPAIAGLLEVTDEGDIKARKWLGDEWTEVNTEMEKIGFI